MTILKRTENKIGDEAEGRKGIRNMGNKSRISKRRRGITWKGGGEERE
jgi:hypothetical protein